MAKLVPCKTCTKEVAASATKCPHCGQSNPTITGKDVRNIFISLFIIVVVLTIYISSDTKKPKWHENGNLHSSIVKEWKQSTAENKLATAADWVVIASKKIKSSVEASGDVNNVKPYATELVTCIDKTVNGTDIADHQKSSEIAITCMTLVGWI